MRIQLAAVAAVLAGTAASAPAQSVDATIDRAVAAWAKIKTVRGTFDQTVSNQLTNSTATSRGQYAQDRPNLLSIRFTQPASDAIVSDGKIVWVYLPSTAPGQVLKRSATDRSQSPIDLTGTFLDSPRTKYDITAAPAKTVDGHATHGLALVPKAGVNAPFSKATVWVDDDDAFIREFDVTESTGVSRHIHLTSVEPNVPLSKDLFVFAIPSGAKIIDQTK
jgi:outer membrane lipoprotein carrier protein